MISLWFIISGYKPNGIYKTPPCRNQSNKKKQCDILIVGLQTDPTIDRPNKNKPVQTLDEREIQLKSNRYVDFYFIYSIEDSLYQSLKDLQPNIRFLGDDYKDRKDYTGSDLSHKVIFINRDHGWSTTKYKNMIAESLK